jgi:hypothetical protein
MKTTLSQQIFDVIFWNVAALVIAAALGYYAINSIQLPAFR